MSNMPDKVTAVTYVVPLSCDDKVVGRATISIEKISLGSEGRYVRNVTNEVGVDVVITDHDFQDKLSRKLLNGLSITLEEDA